MKRLPKNIPRTSNFYGLSKIHKSKEIKIAVKTQKSEYEEIPNPSDLKFRPIVAGPSCSINRLSKIFDILQLFLYKVKSYIRNDIHFLNSIPQKTDPNTLMVTFDVTNQYPP